MDISLKPHSSSGQPPFAVRVRAARVGASELALVYRVLGPIARLRTADPLAPARVDGLWKTTCFELFIAGDGDAYREYNFSPSTAWAAYAFDAYRAGGRDAPTPPPIIRTRREEDALTVDVTLALPEPAASPLALGLTAVLEDADGGKSYWALAHADVKPDFHRRETFLLTLNHEDRT
jgi:hypothetical protein